MTTQRRLPSEIRDQLVGFHSRLRRCMSELEPALSQADAGAAGFASATQSLLQEVRAYLSFQERELEPAIRTVDAWGPVRADRLNQDRAAHVREAARLEERLRDPSHDWPTRAALLRTFVDAFSRDIDEEDRDIVQRDLFRDDAIQVNNIFVG